MEAELQGLEVEAGLTGDHQLSIDHRSRRELLQDRGFELGKVSIQGFEVATLQEPFPAVPKEQHTESVPFRLVEPAVTLGQSLDELGQHGANRWLKRQVHAEIIPYARDGDGGDLAPAGGEIEDQRPQL